MLWSTISQAPAAGRPTGTTANPPGGPHVVRQSVQIAGILLCVMDGRDVTKCECFRDLAIAETKERVNQMLIAAMSDWANLARFRPKVAQS